MLDVSIITVHHHHRGMIERCIESVMCLPDRATFELLVVDNTPEDGLSEWVKEKYPSVSIRGNGRTLGYAANANLGVRTAVAGRYALLLNPDVICLPGLLDILVAFLDENPPVALAAPKLLNLDGSLQPSCRSFPTALALGVRFARLDRFLRELPQMRRYLMTDSPHAESADVDWVTGAVVMLRREAFQAVGSFDESYFLYWEDLDLCLRLWHAGWRVCYVPQAQATHEHLRQGVRNPFSKFARWQIAGALKIFRKFGVSPRRRAQKTGKIMKLS